MKYVDNVISEDSLIYILSFGEGLYLTSVIELSSTGNILIYRSVDVKYLYHG